MKVAFATTDGHQMTSEHFGDARFYPIYEIDNEGVTYIKTIENTTEAEEEHGHHHGNPHKAQGIGRLMKQHGVQVLVGKAFGPNIVRMKSNFAIVLVKDQTVEQAVQTIQKNFDKIKQLWEQGESRNYLNLKVSS